MDENRAEATNGIKAPGNDAVWTEAISSTRRLLEESKKQIDLLRQQSQLSRGQAAEALFEVPQSARQWPQVSQGQATEAPPEAPRSARSASEGGRSRGGRPAAPAAPASARGASAQRARGASQASGSRGPQARKPAAPASARGSSATSRPQVVARAPGASGSRGPAPRGPRSTAGARSSPGGGSGERSVSSGDLAEESQAPGRSGSAVLIGTTAVAQGASACCDVGATGGFDAGSTAAGSVASTRLDAPPQGPPCAVGAAVIYPQRPWGTSPGQGPAVQRQTFAMPPQGAPAHFAVGGGSSGQWAARPPPDRRSAECAEQVARVDEEECSELLGALARGGPVGAAAPRSGAGGLSPVLVEKFQRVLLERMRHQERLEAVEARLSELEQRNADLASENCRLRTAARGAEVPLATGPWSVRMPMRSQTPVMVHPGAARSGSTSSCASAAVIRCTSGLMLPGAASVQCGPGARPEGIHTPPPAAAFHAAQRARSISPGGRVAWGATVLTSVGGPHVGPARPPMQQIPPVQHPGSCRLMAAQSMADREGTHSSAGNLRAGTAGSWSTPSVAMPAAVTPHAGAGGHVMVVRRVMGGPASAQV